MTKGVWTSLVFLLMLHAARGVEYFSWSHASQYDPNIKRYVLDNFHTDTSKAFGWKESSDTDSLKLALDPAGSGEYVLQVFYEKGTRSSYDTTGKICVTGTPCRRGVQFYVMPPMLYQQSKTYAALEYEVYFKQGFEFVKGGKLPGLYGGNRDSCKGCKGVNDCFSARLMWRTDGHYEVYGYIPEEQAGGLTDWCDTYKAADNMVRCSSSCGTSIGRTYSGSYKFLPGQWYKIRQEIDVGQANEAGRVALWVDGALIVQMTNIVLRTSSEIYVDGLFFSTFYGGSSSSFGAHGDTYSYFRNIRISDDVLQGDFFIESN